MTKYQGLTEPLSDRERQILECLAEGLTNHEISSQLHLAYQTVKSYNSEIYSKLGVNNRQEAIENASALGLLTTPLDTSGYSKKHNLPESLTPFVGRKQEIFELDQLLRDSHKRLITILAPGGMGKTRLAVEFARRQVGTTRDGVYFIPLAPLGDPAEIITTIAEIIGFVFQGKDEPIHQLINFLKGREMLLVLDNFDHLVNGAYLIGNILKLAPEIKIIVASRERLNLHGENVYGLGGLEFTGWESPKDESEIDAAKLFVQHAKQIHSKFSLESDELDFLARICLLTEGMPLALELAAGWVDVLSIEQIANEIQQGIDIFETEMRDIPERHRSLRATFERTWHRLTEEQQTIFARLSVFRGGFTLESAGKVAGATIHHLKKFVQKALIPE